ncbi:hypothetical protein CDAR_500001 [Caerostris darwini]|uniref:Uncharacterized protein n=1 Tax=Caerostris darwini TaxID=1538125 RepID=A0AAV4MVP4_9ARAC|nr:hypothetical protein CDAR_500001 [Caerostris darwini]
MTVNENDHSTSSVAIQFRPISVDGCPTNIIFKEPPGNLKPVPGRADDRLGLHVQERKCLVLNEDILMVIYGSKRAGAHLRKLISGRRTKHDNDVISKSLETDICTKV